MRVGIVAPPWLPVPPPSYGGTESVLDCLARGLQAAGHEVLLATTGDATCPVPRTSVLRQAAGDRMGDAVVELRHVLHAYDALRHCDLVHDHTTTGALVGGHPTIVVTNHNLYDATTAAVFRAIARRAAVVAISHDQARMAHAAGVPVTAVIHHGIDTDAVPVGDGGGGYVAFLGRMSPDKGVVEACRAARAAGVPLLIAAKQRAPEEHAYFEAEVAPLLGPDVEYVGELGTREKLRLLGGADALLSPIHWHEPFGLVLVEALACGTPVITTPHGAAPEIVEHGRTGFVCDTPADLVTAIHEARTIDRAACRAAAVDRFSMGRMATDHAALYERLLDPGPVTRGAGSAGAVGSFAP